jgi:CRP-like cAMP-binding protein
MQTLEVTPETWRKMFEASQPMRCCAGSLIFSQHEFASGMYLICSGDVWLSVQPEQGISVFGRHVRQGSLIGVAAAMTCTDYNLTAEALTEVELGFVSSERLPGLMSDEGVAYELVKMLSVEVRALQARLALHVGRREPLGDAF